MSIAISKDKKKVMKIVLDVYNIRRIGEHMGLLHKYLGMEKRKKKFELFLFLNKNF